MKRSRKALKILAKMQGLIELDECSENREQIFQKFMRFLPILKMHTSGFLTGSLFQIHLGEQLGKLGYEAEDYFSEQPILWTSRRNGKDSMVLTCMKARGLIMKHAEELEG